MRKFTLAASLLIAPAFVQAQGGVQAHSHTTVDASVAAKSGKATQGSAHGSATLSAEAQAKVDANLRAARERKLPDAPIRRRVAEGQAKGASEAQIVAASGRTLVDLQSANDAMIRGGHAKPSEDEVSRGAQLVAQGYTSVQIEAIARRAPSDRSLVVAFETLTSLQAEGKSTARALAQVESLLEAKASDAQLRGLAVRGDAAAGLNGTVHAGRGAGTVGAGAATAASAAGSVAGSAAAGAGAAATGGLTSAAGGTSAGVTGAVSGTVGGALGKKP